MSTEQAAAGGGASRRAAAEAQVSIERIEQAARWVANAGPRLAAHAWHAASRAAAGLQSRWG